MVLFSNKDDTMYVEMREKFDQMQGRLKDEEAVLMRGYGDNDSILGGTKSSNGLMSGSEDEDDEAYDRNASGKKRGASAFIAMQAFDESEEEDDEIIRNDDNQESDDSDF